METVRERSGKTEESLHDLNSKPDSLAELILDPTRHCCRLFYNASGAPSCVRDFSAEYFR